MREPKEAVLEALMDEALGTSRITAYAKRMNRVARRLSRFGLALSRTPDPRVLERIIVTEMARAVEGNTAALALIRPSEQALAIVATLGYPGELVSHVRIPVGVGVLGEVFVSGRAVLRRAPANAGTRSRRYRSDTYLAVPLRGPEGVLGVVSVTDGQKGEFDRADLMVLRAFSIPAGLALSASAARDQLSRMSHLASVDPLTGAFNRRHFDERLEQELERQERSDGDLALLLVDIDNFKQLNDLRGHLHGDRVLRDVVDILKRSVRIFDLCSRFGGEEFAVLMPGANARTAFQIGERIRRNTEIHFGRHLLTESGHPWPTLSVGIAIAHPGTSGDDLIRDADSALLDAKRSGKNMVRLYGDPQVTGRQSR